MFKSYSYCKNLKKIETRLNLAYNRYLGCGLLEAFLGSNKSHSFYIQEKNN